MKSHISFHSARAEFAMFCSSYGHTHYIIIIGFFWFETTKFDVTKLN